MKKLIIISLLLVSAFACVNQTYWVAEASCLNCTNTSTNYQCFDLTEAIDDGILSSTWYSDLQVLNTTANHTNPYCYDNDNTERVCSYNINSSLTIEEWTFNLRSVDTDGTNFTSCGFIVGDWPEANYIRCKNITLGLNFTTDETIYLNVTYDSDMLANMNDIKFYDTYCNNNGNELSYDIEAVVASTYGEYHVLPNQNFTTGDIISMYYGYASAGDNTDASTVWSDCDVVYYFEETSGTNIEDHSGNGNNGTLTTTGGVTMADEGLIGKGLTLRPGSYVSIPNTDFKSDTQGSIYYNIKILESGLYQDVFFASYGNGASQETLSLAVDNSDLGDVRTYTSVSKWLRKSTPTLPLSTWAQLVSWVNSTGNDALLNITSMPIIAGSDTDTTWFSGINSGQVAYLNRLWYGGTYYSRGNFTIDHFRICNTPKSSTWANTTLENIFNHNSYITFGSEMSIPSLQTGCEGANCTIWTPNITQNYGFYTLDIFDEADNTAWDMGATHDEEVTFTCETSQSIHNITSNSNNNYILYDNPRVVKLSVNFTATGEDYYRKQVPTCTFPCTETQDFYLVNLNVSDLVEVTFDLQDWTDLFDASEIRIKRPILTSGIIQITSDLFSASNKAIINLIKDMEYQIELYKNGVTKSIGYIIVDDDTSKVITVGDVAFNPDEVRLYEDIIYGAGIDIDYITAYYNDTSNSTTSVTWNVYNATNGTLLYTTSSTCNLCSFSWNYSNDYTSSYSSNIIATIQGIGTINTTDFVNYFNSTSYVGEGSFSRNTFRWIGVIFLSGIAMLVTAQSLSTGAILFAVFSIIFQWIGWLQLNSIILFMGVIFAFIVAALSRRGST